MKNFKLKERLEKNQKEAWSMAEQVNSNLMKLKDRIYESGLVVEENKCLMKLAQNETEESIEEYMAIIREMKVFYRRMVSKQFSME